MVTLQFSTQHAFDSALIRFLTWSAISHVDFELTDGSLLGSRLRNGVQLRAAGYSKFSKVITATVDVPATPVLAQALSQVGKPYDWRSILNFGLHRNWRESDSWFCSELVAWSFEKAGYPLLNPYESYSRVTPRDLLLSPYVTVQPPQDYCESCGTTHA